MARRTAPRAPRRRGCGTRSTGGAPVGARRRAPAASSPSWRAPRRSGTRACSPPRCSPPRPPPQPAGGQVRPGRVFAPAGIRSAVCAPCAMKRPCRCSTCGRVAQDLVCHSGHLGLLLQTGCETHRNCKSNRWTYDHMAIWQYIYSRTRGEMYPQD